MLPCIFFFGLFYTFLSHSFFLHLFSRHQNLSVCNMGVSKRSIKIGTEILLIGYKCVSLLSSCSDIRRDPLKSSSLIYASELLGKHFIGGNVSSLVSTLKATCIAVVRYTISSLIISWLRYCTQMDCQSIVWCDFFFFPILSY